MSFPVRGGTVFGPATPQPSTAGVPLYTENMWSAPIAMLSMTRCRWKLLPHRAGVFRVAFPYWVMSRRLKFPVSGSSHVAMRWPLGPSFRHARPAVKPEKSANGTIDPNPAPTTARRRRRRRRGRLDADDLPERRRERLLRDVHPHPGERRVEGDARRLGGDDRQAIHIGAARPRERAVGVVRDREGLCAGRCPGQRRKVLRRSERGGVGGALDLSSLLPGEPEVDHERADPEHHHEDDHGHHHDGAPFVARVHAPPQHSLPVSVKAWNFGTCSSRIVTALVRTRSARKAAVTPVMLPTGNDAQIFSRSPTASPVIVMRILASPLSSPIRSLALQISAFVASAFVVGFGGGDTEAPSILQLGEFGDVVHHAEASRLTGPAPHVLVVGEGDPEVDHAEDDRGRGSGR